MSHSAEPSMETNWHDYTFIYPRVPAVRRWPYFALAGLGIAILAVAAWSLWT